MNRKTLAASAAVLMLAVSTQARAAEPSNFVLCDGNPANMGLGELSLRLLAVTATAGIVGGIVGAPETANTSKRADADAGVIACDSAIAAEKDPSRQVQLTLARSIHLVEAGQFDQALNTAKSIDLIAPDRSKTDAFRRGPAQSSLELQAATLARMGRAKEASAIGVAMAESAPYSLLTQIRAVRYIELVDEMTPAKSAYYDRLSRILPGGLSVSAAARSRAGDFKGAARDLDAYDALRNGFFPVAEETPLYLTANRAVAHMLIGDMKTTAALTAIARTDADRQAQGATTGVSQSTLSQAEELLDFVRIGQLLTDGKLAEARAAFGARNRWLAPSPAAVAWMTGKLREGADPAQLTGALARTPEAVRADAEAARLSALVKPDKANKDLFSAVRAEVPDFTYRSMAPTVWNTGKSRYLVKRSGKEKFEGEMILVFPTSIAAPEALLLHSALLAKSRGQKGFALAPSLVRLDTAVVRFGAAGEAGLPAEAFQDADAVIAALSPLIPDPATKTR